ncbi:MAG: MalY/PatB family protein [Pseudomonadota bacterium]
MDFDFDKVIDRRQTNSDKWDEMEAIFGVSPEDGLAMWTADMDFVSPRAVNATLEKLAAHGVQGYFGDSKAYKGAVRHWMSTRHGWKVEDDWILTTHGVVHALGACIQAYSAPGDGVITFTPVYHAFHRMIDANNRRNLQSEMRLENGRYEMDLAGLEQRLQGDERIILLCSPHNPGGRVWSGEELNHLASFCARHDLILVSDEIHQDLVYAGHTHHVAPLAAPDHLDRIVVLNAPSKTFNLAGAKNAQAIIPDPALRSDLQAVLRASGTGVNRISALLTTAAYAHGAEWLDALLVYLNSNRQMFEERVNALPGVRSIALESTYLSWVDFSGTGMDMDEITRRIQTDARIAANHGPTFGKGGEHFMRFNFGTSRAVVSEALERLEHAFSDLQ